MKAEYIVLFWIKAVLDPLLYPFYNYAQASGDIVYYQRFSFTVKQPLMNSSRALKQLFLNLRIITRDILQLMLESSLVTTILVKINSFTGIFQ